MKTLAQTLFCFSLTNPLSPLLGIDSCVLFPPFWNLRYKEFNQAKTKTKNKNKQKNKKRSAVSYRRPVRTNGCGTLHAIHVIEARSSELAVHVQLLQLSPIEPRISVAGHPGIFTLWLERSPRVSLAGAVRPGR